MAVSGLSIISPLTLRVSRNSERERDRERAIDRSREGARERESERESERARERESDIGVSPCVREAEGRKVGREWMKRE